MDFEDKSIGYVTALGNKFQETQSPMGADRQGIR